MNTALAILAIVLLTLTFEGILFGQDLAERSFPSYSEPNSGGFFGVLDAILSIVKVIWGAIVFFFNLITFNVPDAPWFVRLPVAGLLGGGLTYSIAVLIRGGGDA